MKHNNKQASHKKGANPEQFGPGIIFDDFPSLVPRLKQKRKI